MESKVERALDSADIYLKHRIANLYGYGWDARAIAEYLALPAGVVHDVLLEEPEFGRYDEFDET